MAPSRLTARTLAMAMAALVLACVHAARGDGRSVASFTSGARSGNTTTSSAGSSGTGGGGVLTIHGEPWKADQHPTAQTKPTYIPTRVALNRPRRDPSARSDEPVCIVRRVSDAQFQRERSSPDRPVLGSGMPQVQTPIPPAAVSGKPAQLIRNAFALSPTMGAALP